MAPFNIKYFIKMESTRAGAGGAVPKPLFVLLSRKSF